MTNTIPDRAKTKSIRKTPVDFLMSAFQTRKERNPSYSVSAFARDLGISTSLLSRVLSGSRPISLKLAMHISAALDLKENETNALILTVIQNASKNAKISKKVRAKLERELGEGTSDSNEFLYSTVEIEQFKAMAHWYHLAILNLASVDDFESDPAWIARHLRISVGEAREAIDRLISIGLLAEKDEKLTRTQMNFYVKTKSSNQAIRNFHKQMIGKATDELEKISDQDFQKRLINGITFTCGEEHLEGIKDKIDRFQDEVLAFTSQGERKNVYQLNVQFFPLTKMNTGESK